MIALKKLTFYFILLLIILFSAKNYYSTTLQFFFSNLSIRDGFNYENNSFFDANNDGKLDFVKKGTHDGGQEYFDRIYKYIDYFKDFDFNKINSLFLNLKDVDINNSKFRKEYDLIMLLKKYSKINKINKQKLGIHIPKSNSVFWNISCDSLMIPFIVPAISNIVLINGLPSKSWNKSCFGQIDGYGYGIYLKKYEIEIPEEGKIYNNKELCKTAKKYNISKIIKINFDEKEEINETMIDCIK